MKPGTIVKLPDGREGTTVYHNLDGYGIVWGRREVDEDDLPPPEAMLRDPYPSATVECVGKSYVVVEAPSPPARPWIPPWERGEPRVDYLDNGGEIEAF
jgi:hypothetical protein